MASASVRTLHCEALSPSHTFNLYVRRVMRDTGYESHRDRSEGKHDSLLPRSPLEYEVIGWQQRRKHGDQIRLLEDCTVFVFRSEIQRGSANPLIRRLFEIRFYTSKLQFEAPRRIV